MLTLPKRKTVELNALIIPENWESIESFADWYVANGLPIRLPIDHEVFLSDDATAVCIFRHKQFQVETYLIHPSPLVPLHEHPGVEVIKARVVDDKILLSEVLRKNESHGAGFRVEFEKNGFFLLAIQKWDEDLTPSTVAARWRGRTVGPKHREIIKRFSPNALILEDYADVTKTMDYIKDYKNE
jgi:hypothetical protein